MTDPSGFSGAVPRVPVTVGAVPKGAVEAGNAPSGVDDGAVPGLAGDDVPMPPAEVPLPITPVPNPPVELPAAAADAGDADADAATPIPEIGGKAATALAAPPTPSPATLGNDPPGAES